MPQRMFVQSAVKGPGIRTHKITIRNEKDCIKVKQKGWLDKKDAVEIHDIPSAGLCKASKRQGSCWIRMAQI